MQNDFYMLFEDKFRGSKEEIKKRLSVYLPCVNYLKEIDSNAFALDLGCGRGEWLELLIENNWKVLGIDFNDEMIKECSKKNIPAMCGDAIKYLEKKEEASVSLISGFHLAEHLEFDNLLCLIRNAYRVLRPGGILILETPNPENILVSTYTFYLDPSHNNPIPPVLLQFITENSGFIKNEIVRLNSIELKDEGDLLSRQLMNYNGANRDYSIIAQKGFDDMRYDKCLELINKKPPALDLLLEKVGIKDLKFRNMDAQIQGMNAQIQGMNAQIEKKNNWSIKKFLNLLRNK